VEGEGRRESFDRGEWTESKLKQGQRGVAGEQERETTSSFVQADEISLLLPHSSIPLDASRSTVRASSVVVHTLSTRRSRPPRLLEPHRLLLLLDPSSFLLFLACETTVIRSGVRERLGGLVRALQRHQLLQYTFSCDSRLSTSTPTSAQRRPPHPLATTTSARPSAPQPPLPSPLAFLRFFPSLSRPFLVPPFPSSS